ncbi:DUF3078 domain-containing protein [Salisaeta longa]|uniref:DUF3078 domain-containing protein n=1 Tax=Salisaeta longa TaxID=503170 RepID=UPI0003B7587A|nr:DUF3078 domain-containing protein [Salisaeta longa]
MLVRLWLLLLAAGGFLSSPLYAMPADTTWSFGLSGEVAGSQAAYRNWQSGSTSSLMLKGALDARAVHAGQPWHTTIKSHLAFGVLRRDEERLQTADDVIHVQVLSDYRTNDSIDDLLNPTLGASARTQFAKGFNFSQNPYPAGHPRADADLPVVISRFLSPAYFTQSVGLTYSYAPVLEVRVGGAAKQTMVLDDSVRVLYNLQTSQAVRFEAGAEVSSKLQYGITSNIRYNSALDLFFAFNQSDTPPDMSWEHTLKLTVNDWMHTNVLFVALFDRDTSRALQLKQRLSVAVSFDII